MLHFVKTVDTPSDLITVNDQAVQVEVLSSQEKIALDYHENVIEKGLETFIEVGQSLQYIRDNRLYRKDYDNFADYVKQRWGRSRDWANKLVSSVEVTQVLASVEHVLHLPENQRQAQPLAKLKDNPELMAQAWIELTGKTKEQYEEGLRKSAQPTHKEVEAKVKEYEKKIEELSNKQTSLKNELKEKNNTIENQNKKIKELTSDISAKTKELEEIADTKANLDSIILARASVIATEEVEKELKQLEKEKAKLTAKEEQIKKQLKEAETLKAKAEQHKKNLDETTQWLDSFTLTNEYLMDVINQLKKYKKDLQKNPDLSSFPENERLALEAKIREQVVDLNNNLHELGGQTMYLSGAVAKFNNHALRVIDAEVENE